MQITEKDLEDLIFSDLEHDPVYITQTGLRLNLLTMVNDNNIHWMRQVDLKHYGRADIIGYSRFMGRIYVDVIELKNVPLQPDDFNQVFRYKAAVMEILHNTFKGRFSFVVNSYLIGPSMNEGHWIHNNSNCIVYTFKFGLHGFRFTRHDGGWHLGEGKLSRYDYSCSDSLTHPPINVYGQIQESTDIVLG